MSAHHAFIAYLRVEAEQQQERADALRSLIASIEAGPDGKPPKRVKREAAPSQVTAYSLFVQENFQATMTSNPTLKHKDVVAAIARHWARTNDEEKQLWHERAGALQNREISVVVANAIAALERDMKALGTKKAKRAVDETDIMV